MTPPDPAIVTGRLTLIPCAADLIEALMRDEPVPGMVVHPSFPDDELRGALPFMLAAARADSGALGWGPWLIVRDGIVIGSCGGHGPPGDDGSVEIGFGVVPEERGAGVATEAVAALVAWMKAHSACRVVLARTAPDNVAAQAVLRATGFVPGEMDGDLVVFRA